MSRATLLMLAVALTPSWFATDCVAVTKTWAGGSGNWSPGNWSPAGAPVAGDPTRIVFTDGVARTVTLNTNTPALGLVSIDLTGAGTAASTLSIPTGNTITAGAMLVGGHNGTSPTNGRGVVTQSAGTASTTFGLDWVIGYGAGSSGTYNLSGTGAVVASQSEFIGYGGTGVFNHSGGTNTINAGAIGSLNMGTLLGSSGTYNLSGTGQLISNKSEYVGDQGSGLFYQTGGTNAIQGAGNDLYLGYSATGNGMYSISGGSLTVADDVIIGQAGQGVFSVTDQASVIADSLTIGALGTLNMTGGTLRLLNAGAYTRALGGVVSFSGGTLVVGSGFSLQVPMAVDFFGVNKEIPSGAALVGIGVLQNGSGQNVNVIGGTLQAPIVTNNSGAMLVSNGGRVLGSQFFNLNGGSISIDGVSSMLSAPELEIAVGSSATANVINGGTIACDSGRLYNTGVVTINGVGSKWIVADDLTLEGVVNLQAGSLVDVGDILNVSGADAFLNINGGTLRVNSIVDTSPAARVTASFTAGAIQLPGDRSIGGDATIAALFGSAPSISPGKSLVVEGIASLATSTTLNLAGGQLVAGTIALPLGSRLTSSSASQATGPVLALAGSRIEATTGDLVIGDAAKVNGFYGNGMLFTGDRIVTLADANVGVFDSAAIVSLGNGLNPGTLHAANGLLLDFGGNMTGFGDIETPNSAAKPFINNGDIAGASAGQPITLPGYVKGVGTFDNVVFGGTYSPGLSPTSQIVGSIGLADTGTLLMEIGGTSPGSGHDQVLASGDLRFDGVLEVQLLGGFTPTAGQAFNLFDWGTVNGTFDTLTLPALAGDLAWNTSQLYTTGVLSVAAAGLPGDYNSDGQVNAADYTVWRDNLGNATALPNDDTPGVAADDYTRWASQYGTTAPASTHSQSIPEPAAALLAFLATTAIGQRRRV